VPHDRKTPKAARSAESLTRSNRPKVDARYLDDRGSRIHPVFSFELADRNQTAEWGWHLVYESNASRLVEMLRTWGSSTWNEIRAQTIDTHKRHHWQDIGSLCVARQHDGTTSPPAAWDRVRVSFSVGVVMMPG
jgi:hypothetical protein